MGRESYGTPAWAASRLIAAGGLNRFGEPNFRVTWSNNLLDWIGGRWEDRDSEGSLLREVLELRYLPKYAHLANRWIIEQWEAPEKFGSPQSWLRQTKHWGEDGNIPQLGPYPERGRYAFLCVLDTKSGGWVQLTSTLLDEVITALRWKQNQVASLAQLRQLEAARRDVSDVEARDYIASDARPFNSEPFVTVL